MRKQDFFIINPELLDNPEVKEIIDYMETEVKEIQINYGKYEIFFDKVNDIFFHSEKFLKNGRSCHQTIGDIAKLINEHHRNYH